ARFASRLPPWIQRLDPRSRDVRDVPGDESQAAHFCCCGDQAIDDGEWIRDIQTPPLLDDLEIDRENPIAMLPEQPQQPLFQRRCRSRIPPADVLDSSSDLADRENAQKDVGLGNG